jgi:hypothetical protein
LSNHQVTAGESVYGYGSGFEDVTGVEVGSEWAPDFRVDGTTVVTFTVPHGAGGATEWVVLHVPEQLRVDAGATSVPVQVFGADGAGGTLQVPCIQIADATSAGGAPAVLGSSRLRDRRAR